LIVTDTNAAGVHDYASDVVRLTGVNNFAALKCPSRRLRRLNSANPRPRARQVWANQYRGGAGLPPFFSKPAGQAALRDR
jgi:hypothetical protein